MLDGVLTKDSRYRMTEDVKTKNLLSYVSGTPSIITHIYNKGAADTLLFFHVNDEHLSSLSFFATWSSNAGQAFSGDITSRLQSCVASEIVSSQYVNVY